MTPRTNTRQNRKTLALSAVLAGLTWLALVLVMLALSGCMSPNWMRLIPENKDLDAIITTPYGTLTIHSRVNPSGTNGLGPITSVTPVSGLLMQAR